MSESRGSRLPCGFGGPVGSWHELTPDAERVLRIPAQGIVDGPFRRLPKAVFDFIAVQVTESLGRIEGLLQLVADRLAPGGRCLLEVENPQGPRSLHRVVEGRTGALDPDDSLSDPAQALPLRRVLWAVEAAGLVARDCVAVPSAAGLDPGFAESLFGLGFEPLEYVRHTPPCQYWVVCQKTEIPAGTAIVGAGSRQAQEATEQGLRRFLPPDWEVVCCSGSDEVKGFNRAVPDSAGEFIWFLRAGATADEQLFKGLRAGTVFAPSAPGLEGDLSNPGDLSGLMLSRRDLLALGPLPEQWQSPQVAYEDWGMLLQAKIGKTRAEDGSFETPPPDPVDLAVIEREGQELVELWSALGGEGEERADDGEGVRPEQLGPEPRITVCMITKNEEGFLDQCLKSAASVADEIVVVDTGSTDRTVEIAESHGARVLHVPWTDDFSAPRNASLEAATGDWILVLDADETLEDDAGEKIRELVRKPEVSGYHLLFKNKYSKGKTLGVLMVRLFRRMPGVRYEKRIHEQVTPSLLRASCEAGMVVAMSDVEVTHEGYTEEMMRVRSKNQRNERLFLLQLEDDPKDIYTLYKYGDFLRRVPGRNRDARAILEETLDLILRQPPLANRELPYAGEVAALCALEYAREDRDDKAEEVIDSALRRFSPTPNLHYIAASLALKTGRNDDAIAHYRRCLSYRGEVLVVPIQEGITGHVSITGIAQAWLQKGDRSRARRLLDQAIEMEPEYDVTHMSLSRLYFEEGDMTRALTVLTDYLLINPDSAGVCQQATLILKRLGLDDQARRMGERALTIMDEGAMEYESEDLKRTLATLC